MRLYIFLFFLLASPVFSVEEKSGYKTKLIQAYIVNKADQLFQGKYKFIVEEGVAVMHQEEGYLKIKPGHKQTLQFIGYTHTSNKLLINNSYEAGYILHVEQFALSVSTLNVTTGPISHIDHMSVSNALKYPETPVERSSCVMI